MAKNYSFAEAVKVIAEGKDFESIADIGRRFPILANKIAVVTAKAGQDAVDLASFIPEHVTANKVNTMIKNALESGETESEEEATSEEDFEEAPKATKKSEAPKATKKAKSETKGDSENDYASMSGKALYELVKEAGVLKECKAKYGTKKDEFLKFIEEGGLVGGNETEEDSEEDATEENSAGQYDGMKAMDLFKECKNRGIKAAPKKPAKYYIDLLIADDAKATESDAEDDDWDDEEEEAPKTAPKTAKKNAKEAKAPKAAPKKTEDEDDDDWDI